MTDSQKNKEKRREYSKRHYRANKEKIKQYQLDNKERFAERKKAHYQKNKERLIKANTCRKQERIKTDINFKLATRLRSRLGCALFRAKTKKWSSHIKNLGCTIEYLKDYLASKFTEGMTWDNYGINGWHIDHIKPLSAFNLTDPEQQKLACHYTNLQPLWAKDNLQKGAFNQAELPNC